MKKLTTEEFIEKARAIRGDRFDYSQVEYVNNTTKVTIICPDHGSFEQTPANHLGRKGNGNGCPMCGAEIRRQAQASNTKTFIKNARSVHGDRYDYSQVKYVGNKTKVTIICPEHGAFEQAPISHYNNGCGCPLCGFAARAKGQRLNTEIFIERARKVHGDLYDYSLVDYKDSQENVTIICSKHGPFEQMPNNHWKGATCLQCAVEKIANLHRSDTETFIEKARAVHGDRYDYSQVEYANNNTKVTIICPEHGAFEQEPASHVNQKARCNKCAASGFNPSKPATLYYLQVAGNKGEKLYKIGVTNRDVRSRYSMSADRDRIKVLQDVRFEKGQDAYDLEQIYLKSFNAYKYQGEPVLQEGGNTELFTRDIMNIE